MMAVHKFPGAGPARRHLSSPLATAEQRRAAADHLRETCPEDLIFAVPGEVQVFDFAPPKQYSAAPAGGGFDRFVGISLLLAAFLGGLIVGELLALAQIVGRV